MEGMNNVERYEERGKGTAFFAVFGWLTAILSLIRYPFVFGVAGVIMGILATKGGSKAGLPVIVANIIFMSIGLIFNDIIWNYAMHFLGYR